MAEVAAKKTSSHEDLEKVIRAYFIQLTKGCGESKCDNPKCVSSGQVQPLENNVAAAKAIVLAKENKQEVCRNALRVLNAVPSPSKQGKSSSQLTVPGPPPSSAAGPGSPSGRSSSAEPMEVDTTTTGLTEQELHKLSTQALHHDSSDSIVRISDLLYNTFSNPELLNTSFLLPPSHDKSLATPNSITVDISSVRRVYSMLLELKVESIINSLVNAVNSYCSSIKHFSLSIIPLNHIVILLENPLFDSPEFLECSSKVLSVVTLLSLNQKADLIRWYSKYPVEKITALVTSLQQILTISALKIEDHSKSPLQLDPAVISSTHVMMIFYIANLVMSNGSNRPHSENLLSTLCVPIPEEIQGKTLNTYEMLLLKCKVHPAEVCNPPIKLTDFINEYVNNGLNMLTDYKKQSQRLSTGNSRPLMKSFSFLDHPYILDPANKVEKLYFDNQLSMMNERHRALFHVIISGVPDIPFLLLRVDRNNLVSDTLAQLEAMAEWNAPDLRKQLRVEFKDEEGIDEGGVQKEFFQLLTEKLFDPMNGMFTYNETSHFYWFNSDSLESEQQYHLIGILLGLAIYNNVILDIRFPSVTYTKLLGCKTTFKDLYSSHPLIAQSLQSMLDYKSSENEESFENTFMSTFSVSYTDMYSCLQTIPLKENGQNIQVNEDNVQEFVDLYTDWLLNKSIDKQFREFQKGFNIVMGDSSLADLFTGEEVELLICGDKEWDFNTLEENTQYDGFTKAHEVIQNFWEVFYEFSDERKKQLLAFVTGSDRVPVGGLSKMKMVIVKNGPDSDRLPTAHTCFNALLLCNYSSKEKLRERLTKAIEHGKGFGML